MSDPLEQLDRFRSEVEGAPMLTAAEIRRRGDRMRRRGNALKAGVAALAVAAVVVPLSLTGNHGDHPSGMAKDPSTTAPPSALSEANLVGTSDVMFMKGAESFTQSYSGDPDTQSLPTVCWQKPSAELEGMRSAFQRDFTAHSDETGEMADAYLDESIVEFGSADAATAAAQTVKDWYTHCSPSGSTDYTTIDDWRDVSTGTSGTATQMIATYGPADAAPGSQFDVSGRSDLVWYVDVSIIVDGSRVAVLTQNALVPDYDTTAITTTADDVPVAARRLVDGSSPATPPPSSTAGAPGSAPGSGSTGGSGYPATTIPADFPLDSGWDESSPESPKSIVAPNRQLPPAELGTLCSPPFAWPSYVDHLVAGYHNPEDSRDRTLVTFKDADAAVAATAAIVDYFRSCPQHASSPQGYVAHYAVQRSTLSGDSWQISQWNTYNGDPALGATAIHVIRVGLAVLVVSWGGEGGLESMPDYFTQMNREAADPIAAMCAFTEAGC